MKFRQTILACSIAASLAAVSGAAAASGFALIEQSASGLGNAYAGGAASAEDASTIFFNPAGMSRLQGKQIAVAVHAIKPSAKLSNNASVPAALQPTVGGTGGDAGSLAPVPNGYFAMEINPQTRFGLGINAPFGLQTEYDANWIGRFQAIKSKIQTVNLNPSLSYRVSDFMSIGAGISYQRITGDLTSAINYSAAAFTAGGAPLLGAIGGPGKEGVTTISGSDSAWGYNFGVLLNPSAQTRVGLAYRSTIQYNLTGSASFTNRPALLAAAIPDGPVSLAIKMPDTFSASVFHQLNDKWDVMADLNWTGWNVFQQLKVDRANGANLTTVQENWRNTWRVSIGANHHYNEQWTARAGLAYDQTPTSDAFHTARIPDADRTWLSLGGQYKPAKESALDFGYAHLFVNNASINQAVAGAGTLNGTYSNSVDILSAQYTRSF
ncbi:MAG: outer membrane protein transport protein [Nitrosomonadales bacterium]|nr:outer membrane protein transport protein [Nitrosomonadales bacterium]